MSGSGEVAELAVIHDKKRQNAPDSTISEFISLM